MKDLSVVIATLGGVTLKKTLVCLNAGTCIPNEIIICIPKIYHFQLDELNYKNIKIIKTSNKGQVNQRVEGLLQATGAIVLQMDDDIFVEKNTIEDMLNILIKCGKGHAISPIFRDSISKELLTKYKNGFMGFLRNLVDFLIFGANWGLSKMGSISYSGTPFYYDFNQLNKNLVVSNWLPGGMVVCYKEDLVLDSYYPFRGKAYFEDVIHSILWRQKGVKLIVANIVVPTIVNYEKNTLKELVNEYRAKNYVVTLLNYGKFFFCVTFIYSLVMLMIKKFTR